MKRSTKQLISVLICLAMALAMLPVAAFAAGTTTVYCQAPAGWTKCNAYWWGSAGSNPSWPGLAMTQDGDGIWYFEVPSDATGLIFNNGSVQTSDLTVPTDDKTMFVFSNNYWTTYGKVEETVQYYVAGTASLCGVDWQPGASQNKMTQNGDIYTKIFAAIPAGTHKFKVTNGTWAESWGKNAGNDDYVLELSKDINTVEIRFDPVAPSVQVLVNGVDYEAPPAVDQGIYFVAGSFNDWNAAAEGYQMVSNGNGTYTYIMGLDAGDYQLKITNGTWDQSWGSATESGNYELNVPSDDSTVTVTFTFETQEFTVVVSGASSDVTVIAEGTSSFETNDDAWIGESFEFVPGADGTVVVDITSADPGFYLDIWEDENWVAEYYETGAKTISVPVSSGCIYQFIISSAVVYYPGMGECKAGAVTYKITADVLPGEPNQGGGENPGEGSDNSQENPQPITGYYGNYIEAGQTMWFLFDNYDHMMQDGVYTQMLHISAGVPYSVTYRGNDVPVDAEGFVSYEMVDMMYQGKYVFSVTNNGSSKAFFTIEVKDRPAYTVSEYALVLGDNLLVPDAEFANTLYEFTPAQTGVYTFTVSNGFIGNWGTIFNPQDNTGTKDMVLQWTCTAEGQSILIGVAQTEQTVLSVARTGDYVPEDQVPLTQYELTYGFDYQLPENAELIAIDVLDDKADAAVVDQNGFYRYGSAYGPLMVADLNDFPIDLADAYINGQLRAYIRDESGKVTAKYDYNEAMNAYLEAGLVPVTQELGMMLKQLGDHHGWWRARGFVFEGDAPEDASVAWMVACSYIKGSELTPDNGGNGSQGGNNTQGGSTNQGNTDSIPKTTDISMAWAMIVIVMSGTCLLVLKKKESFFLN